MFNFLKGKKTEISITLDRPDGNYYPGETVSITVEILPDKDLKLRSAQVRLCGTEQFKYTSATTSTDSDGHTTESQSTSWGYNEFFNQEEEFLGQPTLAGGQTQRYSFQMSLPADALPSCTADIVRVYWKVMVKLDRPLAGDLRSEKELFARLPIATLNMQPGEFGESSEPNEAGLTLILPGLEGMAGGQLSGQLRVLPQKDFNSEVRLDLTRDEYVSYDEGNTSAKAFPIKLAENTRFVNGQQQTFPFQVPIPPDAAPTLNTPNGEITWKVVGILARRLRKDTIVEQVIVIHPANK